MAKTIHGWNDIPAGYVQEEDFHLAPVWLRAMARIKIVEKFAYPIAVKKGLVKRWKIEPSEFEADFFWSDGIQYINSQYPGIQHGSEIEFELKKTRFNTPFAILKIYSILLIFKSFFNVLFNGMFSTRWGRNKKTEYMKAKIAASKV